MTKAQKITTDRIKLMEAICKDYMQKATIEDDFPRRMALNGELVLGFFRDLLKDLIEEGA